MPVPLALLVMLIEFLGRLSLPVGLLSRLAGLGITVLMVGAILTGNSPAGRAGMIVY